MQAMANKANPAESGSSTKMQAVAIKANSAESSSSTAAGKWI
jgi:hypothetical protein